MLTNGLIALIVSLQNKKESMENMNENEEQINYYSSR